MMTLEIELKELPDIKSYEQVVAIMASAII